jgi:hypothetical protein
LQAAACTPVIAALLCSIVAKDADLPGTEIDLYDRRFELLLGGWEKAKDIVPMSHTLRKRYWHFLTIVAYSIHLDKKRSISYAQLLGAAEQYYDLVYHRTPEIFLADCIHRGLFIAENGDEYSLGHFTYQEFLVAKHLTNDNPVEFILNRIGEDWWLKVFEFYAALKGDLTSLIIRALVKPQTHSYLKTLILIVKNAPLTPKDAIDRLFLAYAQPAGGVHDERVKVHGPDFALEKLMRSKKSRLPN